ncbi:MAG: Gmad2 immunoglobulin-like domain-containing protein [Anaerolineae bacterium]
MRYRHLLLVVSLVFVLAACARPIEALPTAIPRLPSTTPVASAAALSPTITPRPATATPLSPTVALAPTVTVSVAPTAPLDPRGEEVIVISQPDNGSRVTSPVRVEGLGGPTFEQNLGVRLLLDDGTVLAVVGVTIDADLGQRGAYALDLPFSVSEERQGFIQVFDASARDGGILHLTSVGVTLLPSGAPDVRVAQPAPERIAIFLPAPGATVRGGSVHVEGYALAGFEQTLLVEVLDARGTVVGGTPVMVQAPDLGQPGPFSADVAYVVSVGGPGRVVVRDVSPAHGGDAHVASAGVNLQP